MTTTIYLIRHGETEWNRIGRWQGHADVPLTVQGRHQARMLARRLVDEGVRFDQIYASDLSRAFDTAQAIADALETTVQPLADLREIDVGSWSGLSRAEIVAREPNAFSTVFHASDGEVWEPFVDRVSTAMLRLTARHAGETLALVTHGGVVRALLKYVYALQGVPDQQISTIGNTSISELQLAHDRWSVVRFNDISHLNGEQAPDVLAQPNEGSDAR